MKPKTKKQWEELTRKAHTHACKIVNRAVPEDPSLPWHECHPVRHKAFIAFAKFIASEILKTEKPKAVQTIKPPKGWRLLKIGTILKEGDKLWRGGTWFKTMCPGKPVGHILTNGTYIRKVKGEK